jgi:hypothetical protein
VPAADGVSELELLLKLPVPAELVAATLKIYVVPLVRPVTTALTDVEVPSLKVVQFVPPLEEYWTT